METAEKRDQYVYAPSRIYSQSCAATAEALPNEQPLRNPNPQTPRRFNPQTKPDTSRQKSPSADRKEAARAAWRRIISLLTVFAAAAVIISVLARYAIISTEYSELNDLKDDIVTTEQNIAELNVKLNSALNLDDARETALAAGLGYPTADQIVRIDGDSGSAASGMTKKGVVSDTGSGAQNVEDGSADNAVVNASGGADDRAQSTLPEDLDNKTTGNGSSPNTVEPQE